MVKLQQIVSPLIQINNNYTSSTFFNSFLNKYFPWYVGLSHSTNANIFCNSHEENVINIHRNFALIAIADAMEERFMTLPIALHEN